MPQDKIEEVREADKSTFNMGVAMLQRIDQLLTAISIASAKRSLTLWSDLLQTLQREVLYLMSNEEQKANQEYQVLFRPLVAEFQFYEKKKRELEFKKFPILYIQLQKYETFLKHLLFTRGMLVVKKTDSSLF